jgi:general L-amino acid transport system permease protein
MNMTNTDPSAPMAAPFHHWWNDERVRGVLYQIAVLAGIVGLGWFLVANTLSNLNARHIATGFDFLDKEAAFGISEHVIDYAPTDTYLRAFAVGVLNTIEVSFLGVVLTTLLGLVMGIARLSKNWLVANFAAGYVELMRNTPLLLQLFVWYELITGALPGPRQAISLFNAIFLSNRGLKLPAPVWDAHFVAIVAAFALAIVGSFLLSRWARLRQDRTGQYFPVLPTSVALIVGLPVLAFLGGGAELHLDVPHLAGFNFAGGFTLSPEFAAVLVGLVVYTGAFVAEIVRAGILAVPHGQTEAALALGLSRLSVLRLIILPQSLRVIVPPLTSQYLNLTKNSTLAVAVGYPDLVSVGNTAINQTGQAVEGVSIIMAIFLLISLATSWFMNWYNKSIALRGEKR